MKTEFMEMLNLLLMQRKLKVSNADIFTHQYTSTTYTCCHGDMYKLLSGKRANLILINLPAMRPGVAGSSVYITGAMLILP